MVLSLVLGDEIIYLHKEKGNDSSKGTLGKSKKQDKRFVEKEKQFLNGACYRIWTHVNKVDRKIAIKTKFDKNVLLFH